MATKNFNILEARDLEVLARNKTAPCVSIYAPLRNGIFKTKEGPVRFGNQLKAARKYLEKDFSMGKGDIEKFLKPAADLSNDHFFWKTPADGIAAFIAPGIFIKYRLPVKFLEAVTVGNFFDVKPLFPLLLGNEHYYLLVLSKRHVRFFHGTRYSINEIKNAGIPESADIFKSSIGERLIESHGGSSSYKSTIFHGHGGIKDAQAVMLEQFFRAVNKELRKMLMFQTAPLVISGPENILTAYRKVNGYNNIVSAGKEVSIGDEDEKRLAREAWQSVRPYFEKNITDHLLRYEDLRAGGKTSTDPLTITAAAGEGRIETLFCAKNTRVWGRIDPLTGITTKNDKKVAGDEDLAGRAALETFLQKGLVYILSHESLPGNPPLAAILRY